MWRTKHQVEKKNSRFIFCTKLIHEIIHVCHIYQQNLYLGGEACSSDGIPPKTIPLWQLEKELLKLFPSIMVLFVILEKQKRHFNVFNLWKLQVILDVWFLQQFLHFFCIRTQLPVPLKLSLQLSRGRLGDEELFTAALCWLRLKQIRDCEKNSVSSTRKIVEKMTRLRQIWIISE